MSSAVNEEESSTSSEEVAKTGERSGERVMKGRDEGNSKNEAEGLKLTMGPSFSSGSVQVITRLEWRGRRGLGRFICPVVITAATVKILIINSTI